MNGKKFVAYFLVAVVLTSAGMLVWMKQAYDTRPNIKVEKQ